MDVCTNKANNVIPVTSWYGSSPMTFYTDVSVIVLGFIENHIRCQGGSGVIRNAINDSGNSFFEAPTVSTDPDTNPSCVGVSSYKQAFAINTNDASCAVQGFVDSTPDTSVTLPTGQDTLTIGSKETSGGGWEVLNGHIKTLDITLSEFLTHLCRS